MASSQLPQSPYVGNTDVRPHNGGLGRANSSGSFNDEGPASGSGKESHDSRSESARTAVEDNHVDITDKLDPMDRIQTAPAGDFSQPGDVVQGGAARRQRQVYLHQRHNKGRDKQFNEDRTAKRVHKHRHGVAAHRKSIAADPEKQQEEEEEHDDDDDETAPTFWQNILIMCTTFPYWNMAFWSGWCYSIGSALFVIDGCWAWTPLQWPNSEFSGEEKYGVPLLFFFGACLYQIGGVMAYLEAVNDGSFAGATLKRVLQGHQDLEKQLLDAKLHTFFGHLIPHHHHDDDDDQDIREKQRNSSAGAGGGAAAEEPECRWESVRKGDVDPDEVFSEAKDAVERRGGTDHGPGKEGEVKQYMTWRWWPTWHSLFHYHIFELGYIACAIQLFGVTLYGVTSIVILPGILDSEAWWQEVASYWVPQTVASCCFLIASIMFTVMAQDKWYKPKIGAVSWWIGIHAIIGSVGFLLCAVFGFYSHTNDWAEYESSLSSLWGSFFYMLSGLFQWYEAINTNAGPVLAFPNQRTPVLLRKLTPSTSK